MTETQVLKIARRPIGTREPPFIIAEMSGNHNQSLERALEIVNAAAASGVQAALRARQSEDTIVAAWAGDGGPESQAG